MAPVQGRAVPRGIRLKVQESCFREQVTSTAPCEVMVTQLLFLVSDLMENVSVGLLSALWLSEILPPWPQEIPGPGRQTRLTRWLGWVHDPVLYSRRCQAVSTGDTPCPGVGVECVPRPLPSPVQLQGVAVALVSDLILGQATVAVQFGVILVPGHLWLWVP